MKILVTGVAGQLGHDVMNELAARGLEGVGSDLSASYSGAQDGSAVLSMPYRALDITDGEAVAALLGAENPDAVIHCAAWTAVDAAEEEENRAKVREINAEGTEHIARACAQTGARLMYISTDYVFDGGGSEPWQPDCERYAPLNVYGESKLLGELAVKKYLEKFFIVRIAWVFGLSGNNFIRTMLRVGKSRDEVRVVSDQIGTPTYTFDLARLLVDMIGTEAYGCYHVTNEGGYLSWYDFAREIYRQAGYQTRVTPVTTEEYGLSRARRPFNSRMDRSKLSEAGFRPLPDWRDALRRYLEILRENGEL